MSYTRSIPGYYANDPYTPTKADKIYDGLSAGKVKEEVKALIQDEEKARARAGVYDEIEKFRALHPEFDDDEKDHNPNAEYFRTEMKLRGIDPTAATLQDFRDTYRNLKAAGIPLRLKEDVVCKQRTQKNEEAAKDIEAREAFNEDEAYNMDMKTLKKRGGGIL